MAAEPGELEAKLVAEVAAMVGPCEEKGCNCNVVEARHIIAAVRAHDARARAGL